MEQTANQLLGREPAEAVQVDWGEATIILGGCKQKITIWCMRECFSGDIFVTAFYRQKEESFLEGIVTGLEHFGGTPQKIIFDNARVAVKEGFGHHAKATDKYQSLSAHYSFRPVFCNPAQGHEKGLVEGLVGLVRRNAFVPMPNISTLEELNEKLLEYCERYRDHKMQGKSMTVGEMAENCKERWIPLPPFRFDTSNTIQVKADDFSLVRFDHNKYCELQSFYLWLKGRLSPRQRDDLAPVFICCPDERKRLVLEFCDDLHAQHRIKAFLRYFRSIQ